jgi:hypothetical protein
MHGWIGDGHMGWMGIWWICGAAVLVAFALVGWTLRRNRARDADCLMRRR